MPAKEAPSLVRRTEARLHLRVPVRITAVNGEPTNHHGFTLDLSNRGVRVKLDDEVPDGAQIDFIAFGTVQPARESGLVRWCRPRGSGFEAGIALPSLAGPWMELIISEQSAVEVRRQSELERARAVYDHLLPHSFPTLPDVDLHAAILPAEALGGDYFDVLARPNGNLVVAVADVAGKGVPAAITAAAFGAYLRAMLDDDQSLARALGRINRLLSKSLPEGHFVTASVAEVDAGQRVLRYASAGHPPPLLVRKAGTTPLSANGAALGLIDGAEYREGALALLTRDTVCWYTDGVTEATDENDNFYDRDRLAVALVGAAHQTAEEQCASILDDVARFRGPRGHAADDTTVLVMRWNGANG
jgi:sigma-B regulation protein RsbU (phosphoserine phosphatase)